MRAAVVLIDVLNDFLSSFMLEVDIDIRRFAALAANETLKQNIAINMVKFKIIQFNI